MSTSLRLKYAVFAALAFGAVSATGALAETQWQKDHPRRHEVNRRLKHQNARIHEGVKDGQLTPSEAHQLHREDRAIRRQERRDARLHGGHITKAEQNRLNREENAVSNQIHEERHDGQ